MSNRASDAIREIANGNPSDSMESRRFLLAASIVERYPRDSARRLKMKADELDSRPGVNEPLDQWREKIRTSTTLAQVAKAFHDPASRLELYLSDHRLKPLEMDVLQDLLSNIRSSENVADVVSRRMAIYASEAPNESATTRSIRQRRLAAIQLAQDWIQPWD